MMTTNNGTRYVGLLEALLEESEAVDAVASMETRAETATIIAAWDREARRTPKVTISLKALNRDELFVRLGYARREATGWVWYPVYAVG